MARVHFNLNIWLISFILQLALLIYFVVSDPALVNQIAGSV